MGVDIVICCSECKEFASLGLVRHLKFDVWETYTDTLLNVASQTYL